MIAKFDRDDTLFLILSVATPLLLWWLTTGQKKYDTRGMK